MSLRKAVSTLAFTVIVIIITMLISMVNWLPSMFREHTLRRYQSVEEMRSDLRIRRLLIPSYFPQTISWPPSDIAGQSSPFVATLMLFTGETGRRPLLVVTQAADEHFPADKLIPLDHISEQTDHVLQGRTARLEVGICGNDSTCSRISWKDGEYFITLTMLAPPFELLKIASSMSH